jgi:hypothetical protein
MVLIIALFGEARRSRRPAARRRDALVPCRTIMRTERCADGLIVRRIRNIRRPVGAAATLLTVALLPGCSDNTDFAGDATVSTSAISEATSATSQAAGPPHFEACPRRGARRVDTNLRPVPRIDASNAASDPAGSIPRGRVRLEHATNLRLPDGRLGAGNGFEAATGSAMGVAVAAEETIAPVTLAVFDSATAGRRVAFVEVRITPEKPVKWTPEEQLAILTDGGDGGFFDASAPAVHDDPDAVIDGYVRAFFPDGSGAGNACVLRRSAGRDDPDAVLFTTGYGDGGYETFVGLDPAGTIASVVFFGDVLPWRYSGLPGSPPPGNAAG